ncbi:hypothetical protein [Pedobacter sp. V48]|nr:hypothetical protein [Pedobacter sp. V48]
MNQILPWAIACAIASHRHCKGSPGTALMQTAVDFHVLTIHANQPSDL